MYWCYECERLIDEPDENGCCPYCQGELEEEEVDFDLAMEDLKALDNEERWREQRYESIQIY